MIPQISGTSQLECLEEKADEKLAAAYIKNDNSG